MKAFILAIFVLVNLIMQETIFDLIKIGGIKPDFLLILVMFSALLDGPVAGWKMGLAIGLLQDLVSGKFFGLYALCGMTTGYLVGLVETRIFKENYLVPVAVLFIGTIFHEFLYLFLGSLIGQTVQWASRWWGVIFPLAVYHAFIGPILYVPAYKAYIKWWRNDR